MSSQKTEWHFEDANLVNSPHANVRLENCHEHGTGLGSLVQRRPLRTRVKVAEHEARVSALERGTVELQEQVAALVGKNEALQAVNVSFQKQLDHTKHLQDKVETLEGVNDLLKAANIDLQKRLDHTQDRLGMAENQLGESIREQKAIYNDLQKLTRCVPQDKVDDRPKRLLHICKFRKPTSYDGSRKAAVIENFIWDMDKYFKHDPTVSEAEKIDIATSYLTDDAKLWWRYMEVRMRSGAEELCKSWDQMKQNLLKFFCPGNATSNAKLEARRRLQNLRQTGSIRDYVQSYLSIMLEIPNMSNEEQLFNFIFGLQTWVTRELNYMKLETLAQAIAAAENLSRYEDNQGIRKNTNIGKDCGNGKKRFKRQLDGRIQ